MCDAGAADTANTTRMCARLGVIQWYTYQFGHTQTDANTHTHTRSEHFWRVRFGFSSRWIAFLLKNINCIDCALLFVWKWQITIELRVLKLIIYYLRRCRSVVVAHETFANNANGIFLFFFRSSNFAIAFTYAEMPGQHRNAKYLKNKNI